MNRVVRAINKVNQVFLCISIIWFLLNPVSILIFLLLLITSSHSHASAPDSIFDHWRYRINVIVTPIAVLPQSLVIYRR